MKIEENSIPLLRLTGFYSFAGGKSTGAVAVGQRADFKVTLNDYLGNSTNWGPSELWFDSVDGSSGSWANKTWSSPYLETVHAYGIGPGAALDIWVVSAQIKSVTFTGPNYADVKRDDNGQTYASPHYDITAPCYNPPVQYRRGTQPTMDLQFEVLPPEYSGLLYIRALNDLETATNSVTPSFGLAQFLGIQTLESLSDSVGYDSDLIMEWDFSVAADEFFYANTSCHKIYRTLASPSLHYHTSVDVACNGVSGADAATVFPTIWGKFTPATTGGGIRSFDDIPMTYYGADNATPASFAELFSQHDGRCGAWAWFFGNVLTVHSINSLQVMVDFRNTNILHNGTWYKAYEFYVNPNSAAQNNATPKHRFPDHQLVLYNNVYYDPAYGTSYLSVSQWEATQVITFVLTPWGEEPELREPNNTAVNHVIFNTAPSE